MRRLPVYLVVDCSSSMRGEPIDAVKEGIRMLVSNLRRDPQALETVHLSVLTFATTVTQVVPLIDLSEFQVPELKAGGRTAMGDALSVLSESAKREVIKSTPEQKGDWRPLAFIMTDGRPTGSIKKGLDDFHSIKWGMVVCCATGKISNTATLKKISPECVIQLEAADSKSLSAFFKWVSDSISTSSKSVNESKKEVTALGQLPPPPKEISVVW